MVLWSGFGFLRWEFLGIDKLDKLDEMYVINPNDCMGNEDKPNVL